jgi:hypothetical protein
VKWTKLRHHMLARIGRGECAVYIGLGVNLTTADHQFYRGPDLKTASYLRSCWTHVFYPGGGKFAPAKLTAAGTALLTEWDTQHPTPERKR